MKILLVFNVHLPDDHLESIFSGVFLPSSGSCLFILLYILKFGLSSFEFVGAELLFLEKLQQQVVKDSFLDCKKL